MSLWDGFRNFSNSLPFVGGLTSSLWGDPDQENVQKAYQHSQQELAKQRFYNMDARNNMMSQGKLAFGPRNQMLGQMMGQQGPAMNLDYILKNPMGLEQQADIRSQAFPDKVMSGHGVDTNYQAPQAPPAIPRSSAPYDHRANDPRYNQQPGYGRR